MEILGTAIRQEKETKSIHFGREGVKLALYADDKILYIENPRLHTKTINTVNKFSKVAGYKINIWKSVAFLYTNNELSERESFFKKSLLKLHQEKNNILRNKPDQGGVRFTS